MLIQQNETMRFVFDQIQENAPTKNGHLDLFFSPESFVFFTDPKTQRDAIRLADQFAPKSSLLSNKPFELALSLAKRGKPVHLSTPDIATHLSNLAKSILNMPPSKAKETLMRFIVDQVLSPESLRNFSPNKEVKKGLFSLIDSIVKLFPEGDRVIIHGLSLLLAEDFFRIRGTRPPYIIIWITTIKERLKELEPILLKDIYPRLVRYSSTREWTFSQIEENILIRDHPLSISFFSLPASGCFF